MSKLLCMSIILEQKSQNTQEENHNVNKYHTQKSVYYDVLILFQVPWSVDLIKQSQVK